VRIAITDQRDAALVPGMNVTVKIHKTEAIVARQTPRFGPRANHSHDHLPLI
jgi:hypothetical protein